VKVPPRVWNGFKGLSTLPALVANCATIPHDPDEIERLDPHSDRIPYDWSVKHR
jgi:dTDP-4-dehydrorhamnose 3,5-epimerase